MINQRTIQKVIELNRKGESTTQIANELNISGEAVGEIVSEIHPKKNTREEIKEEIEKIAPQSVATELLVDVFVPKEE